MYELGQYVIFFRRIFHLSYDRQKTVLRILLCSGAFAAAVFS